MTVRTHLINLFLKDHPCKVWFNLVLWFQMRRFKCDDGLTPIDGKSTHGLPGELKT